jgi:hypothetical protein
MLMDVAVPAIVEMKSPERKAAPTSSGNVYVSLGCKVLVLTIKFSLPAVPVTVTKFTLMVAADAL